MTVRERMQAILNMKKVDKVPAVEWATWWDKTVAKWQEENSSVPSDKFELFDFFGLDTQYQLWVPSRDETTPAPAYEGAPIMEDEKDYENLLSHLYPENTFENIKASLLQIKQQHDEGKIAVWFTLEGFFWFPRTLFGIENHLYSFYDYPELMKRINTDLIEFHKKVIEAIYEVLTPEFMTFAEDMSYNHGPMISKDLFDEFMAPFYKEIVPLIKAKGTKVFIDTDGDVEPLIPWFKEVGIEGVLPLERQAGVDVNRIRQNHPDWLMMGGFDKTIMKNGEEAMRKEFERLLPAIKSGGYIPSVDHQTPPDVSVENYRIYVKLLREYCEKI
ncbi:MAG: hypothetical protein E7480_03985 [Ruminococcaceae bacterium]|nr:hypothetical protein [Oscillospiraceae bacterium]